MKIHLITYATPRFRLRQLILGWSARANQVVDTVTHWTPNQLLAAGFEERCPGIRLSERGSGYWAWKPFIIQQKLSELPDGDVVFYCDVGRRYPYKQLSGTIQPYLDWMAGNGQDVMPGLLIPWKGPMSMWTKREAFIATTLDQSEVHASSPIQASFSFWISTRKSREIVDQWMNLSAQRNLISDDPSPLEVPALPDYHDHRHDQSLLSLVCYKHGIKGIDFGLLMPDLDTQHPSEIATILTSACHHLKFKGKLIRVVGSLLGAIESLLRKSISFGKPLQEPSIVNKT